MGIVKHRYEDGNTAEWEKLRNSMDRQIGGSEIGTIAGHNPYCSAFTMFFQKCGAIKSPILKKKEAIIQGHDGEEVVAKRFERELGKKVHRENCIMTNDAFPHLKASVDRMVYGEKSGLECKTAREMAMKKYKHGDFPMSYFDQCLLYLAVSQMDRWYLAIQVFGTAFRMFLMTTVKEEADRYNRLKDKFFEWQNFKSKNFSEWTFSIEEKKFVYEGDDKDSVLEIPSSLVDLNDPDLTEWESKWCKLEAVYFVDKDEFAACEDLAKTFVERVDDVLEYMKGWKPEQECESDVVEAMRSSALIAAARQAWPQEEIDGSESTSQTVAELTPDVNAGSDITLDEASPIILDVIKRDELKKQIKEMEDEIAAIENKVALAVGDSETVRMPGWKVTYKLGTQKVFASAAKVKEYFENKGMEVPEGIITTSTPSRSLRFWTQKEKDSKGKKSKE